MFVDQRHIHAAAAMGNEASLPMEMATNFDAEEIKRLGKRFKKLDLVRKSPNGGTTTIL